MGFRFGKPIKQPPAVAYSEPEIRSIELNGDKYIHYEDVIMFLNDAAPERPELRWELDNRTFRKPV